jgi:hypothetical protein
MTVEQRNRIEQRDAAERRRIELAKQIARGEESLIASNDDRTRRNLDAKLTAMRNELHHLDMQLARGFRESFGEFRQRMGCEHIQLGLADGYSDNGCVVGRGSFLFENGALSDGVADHYEAPIEQVTLFRLRKHFIETKLKREVAAFSEFKASCEQQAGYHLSSPMTCPPPPANAVDQLRAGKARIEQLREQLTTLDRENPALLDKFANRAFLDQRRADQQSAREQLNAIAGMTI